jgi:hypothetical protein
LQTAPVGGADLLHDFRGSEAGEGVRRQRRGGAAWSEARRWCVARGAEEHGEVARRGAGRQRILEGAFELALVRVAEDVIDEGAGSRPLDGDGDVQADQFERVVIANVDAGECRLLGVAFPDLRLVGLRLALVTIEAVSFQPVLRCRPG